MRRQIVANDSFILHHKSHSLELYTVRNLILCNRYEISQLPRFQSRPMRFCSPTFQAKCLLHSTSTLLHSAYHMQLDVAGPL